MLKRGITAEELKIYELYLQRIMKEYDLVWIRFKIYLGFNSGVLVVIGFLVKPHLTITPINIPNHILGMCILLSIIGIIFSVAWFLVNRDGRRWQLLMNDVIVKVEDLLFEKTECALYNSSSHCFFYPFQVAIASDSGIAPIRSVFILLDLFTALIFENPFNGVFK